MSINWYPGHMHKAQKELRAAMRRVDVVIEVLDARIPGSSSNPLLRNIRADKPCIHLLHKSDLADPEKGKNWQRWLREKHQIQSLLTCNDEPAQIRQTLSLVRKLSPRSTSPSRALIMGIPNVGKSTVINILAGRSVAQTGNEPAVTKRQQLIPVDDTVSLLDTPGMLWPRVENPASGYRLAITGAIRDTALDYADVGFFGVELLLDLYPARLAQRYRVDPLPVETEAVIELIARQTGCLSGGGMVDYDRVGKRVVQDIRRGHLGRVTLEDADDFEREMEALSQPDAG